MDLFGFGFVSSSPQHPFLYLQSPGLNSGTGKANVLPTCSGVSKVTESEESALGLWPESCDLAGAEDTGRPPVADLPDLRGADGRE